MFYLEHVLGNRNVEPSCSMCILNNLSDSSNGSDDNVNNSEPDVACLL